MKEFNNTVSTISLHLLKTHKGSFKVSKGGGLTFEGKLRRINHLYEDDIDALDSLGVLKDVVGGDKRKIEDGVTSCVLSKLKARDAALAKKNLSDSLKECSDSGLDEISIRLDIDKSSDKNFENKFLINKNTDIVLDSPSVMGLKGMMNKEMFDSLLMGAPPSKKEYNPYLINKTLKDRVWVGQLKGIKLKVAVFNTCTHPIWRYNRDKTIKLTKEEKYFIESSFRSKEDLKYYINAAYTTIVTKMKAYILLFGVKGTGKTTLIEMLENCVGDTNYRKAPNNALKSTFNAYKKNKRLILHDETKANTSDILNTLKSDANKSFNVEEKFKESAPVENYVSTWFASNNLRDWDFTYDERRFSTLELVSETTLDRGISDEWMEKFSERIETDDFSQALFNYLEENKTEGFNVMASYKSPLFHRIVLSSLCVWQSAIVEAITGKEKVRKLEMSSVIDLNDRYSVKRHITIRDFIDNYRHYDHKDGKSYLLGTYINSRSIQESYIIPSDKYMAEKPKEYSDEDIENELKVDYSEEDFE